MTSIVQMLGSEMELVEPKEPGFFPRKASCDEGNKNEISSNEELTVTSLNGRWKTRVVDYLVVAARIGVSLRATAKFRSLLSLESCCAPLEISFNFCIYSLDFIWVFKYMVLTFSWLLLSIILMNMECDGLLIGEFFYFCKRGRRCFNTRKMSLEIYFFNFWVIYLKVWECVRWEDSFLSHWFRNKGG